jgi:3-hydroxyisobutyrate dehydrogenase/putative dehydrogenase
LPVDAPVSGGIARAATGELLTMVGAADPALSAARPVLDELAGRVVVVGDRPGDGQRVKLVNQLLCGVHIAVAAEALAYAESLGLDPAACWETVRHGAAGSFMLDDRGARMVAGDLTTVRSAVDIFTKDLGLVLAAGHDSGAHTPLAELADALFRRASDAGLGRHDDAAVIRMYQQASPPDRPAAR